VNYRGIIQGGRGVCFKGGNQLVFPRGYYSPYGDRPLDWGDKSLGSRQTALLLLLEILGENNGVRALFAHRRFCNKIVSKFPDSWELSHEELEEKVIEVLSEV